MQLVKIKCKNIITTLKALAFVSFMVMSPLSYSLTSGDISDSNKAENIDAIKEVKKEGITINFIPSQQSDVKSKEASLIIAAAKLEALIRKQSEEIIKLKKEIEVPMAPGGSRMSFATWAGILLAAVAVILTALGVIIAVLSFVGFKKILSSAEDVATKVVTEITEKIVLTKIPETTKVELLALLENGELGEVVKGTFESVLYKMSDEKELDLIIQEVVDRVIYQNIEMTEKGGD